MDIATLAPELLAQYGWIAVFFGAFFFGETVIITTAVLVFTQEWSLPLALFLTFLGTIASDSIWFLVGQKLLGPKFQETEKWKQSEKMIAALSGRFHNKPFLILLFIKFLYGTRVLTIVYLSVRNMSFWTFLLFNTIGTVIWLALLFAMSVLAIQSSASLFSALNWFEVALTAGIASLLAIRIINIWITRKIEKL
jgi:membrane protein DedA with SNARE-associated domain